MVARGDGVMARGDGVVPRVEITIMFDLFVGCEFIVRVDKLTK